MKTRQEQKGEVTVIAVSGRLDGKSCPELEAQLRQLVDAGRRRFALDFEQLEYISSAGLRILLSISKALAGTDGRIKIAHLQQEVREVFDLTGFSQLFEICPDIKQCLDSAWT
jgi:anti-anti-sigma factor